MCSFVEFMSPCGSRKICCTCLVDSGYFTKCMLMFQCLDQISLQTFTHIWKQLYVQDTFISWMKILLKPLH